MVEHSLLGLERNHRIVLSLYFERVGISIGIHSRNSQFNCADLLNQDPLRTVTISSQMYVFVAFEKASA